MFLKKFVGKYEHERQTAMCIEEEEREDFGMAKLKPILADNYKEEQLLLV